jgi:DNA-binding response OmpR family regulator
MTPSNPARIVIVDDDWTTRETFQHVLTLEGYRVIAAPTVEMALAEASSERPDAMLLDLHMPIAGGLECLRRLRDIPALKTVPVAIVTGDYFLQEDVSAELREMGARIFFKPLWEEDLRRIVLQLLETRLVQG